MYVCMYVCTYVRVYGNLTPAQLPVYRSPHQVETKNHLELVDSFQTSPKEPSKKVPIQEKSYLLLSVSILFLPLSKALRTKYV